MKYRNAADILPSELLEELQNYASGEILYIPKAEPKKDWGAESGSKAYYEERNLRIREEFRAGDSLEQLAERYGLSYHTIKNIIYQ